MPVSPKLGYYPNERIYIYIGYALGLLMLEWALIRLYQLSTINGYILFIGHVLLSLLSLAIVYFCSKDRNFDMRFPVLISTLFTCAGVWGAGLAIFTLGIYKLYSKPTHDSQWLEDISDEDDKNYVLYERIAHGLEDLTPKQKVISFKDIVAFGTERQKRSAIEKMLIYFIPPFYPILKELLNDRNNSVRIHAATAITRLDRQYYEKFLELEKRTLDFPGHSDFLLELANHCEFSLESGMFDIDRRKKMLFAALMAYMEYTQLNPTNFPVYLAFAKLHLQNNDPQVAKECLEKYFNEKQPVTLYAATLWMEALYNLKEYTQLRNFAIQERPFFTKTKDEKEKEMLEIWSGKNVS